MYDINPSYFQNEINNYIKFEDKIFNIKVLQDQFNSGNFINMYSGKRLNEEFINNILSKEYIKKERIYILKRDDNEEVINSVLIKLEAYINGLISEKQSSEFSKKFFEREEDDYEQEDGGEGEENRENYKEENKQIREKENKVDVLKNENSSMYKTFKYNKQRKVFEEIRYNDITEFEMDNIWPKPRINRTNEIKSS